MDEQHHCYYHETKEQFKECKKCGRSICHACTKLDEYHDPDNNTYNFSYYCPICYYNMKLRPSNHCIPYTIAVIFVPSTILAILSPDSHKSIGSMILAISILGVISLCALMNILIIIPKKQKNFKEARQSFMRANHIDKHFNRQYE